MKKLLILTTLLLLVGCGKAEEVSNNNVETTEANIEQTSKEETSSNIDDADAETSTVASDEKLTPCNETFSMIKDKLLLDYVDVLDDDYILNYYGIDTTLLEDYVFASSNDVMFADTIVYLKAKNEGDVELIKTSIENIVEQKKQELKNYLPEQYNIVNDSEVVVNGNYIYLVILNENKSTAVKLIEDNINGI